MVWYPSDLEFIVAKETQWSSTVFAGVREFPIHQFEFLLWHRVFACNALFSGRLTFRALPFIV